MEEYKEVDNSAEGQQFLELLGLGDIGEQFIPGYVDENGNPKRIRDFLDICGKEARPALIGFSNLSPDDPRYPKTKEILRGFIQKYVNQKKAE
ncbi:MAG: hypothetical protein M1554_02265 [Patescibacteria group bacterium]|jgi:hypothetical protein|nr:hypothetical protein [Patescibacteria group bacterium]